MKTATLLAYLFLSAGCSSVLSACGVDTSATLRGAFGPVRHAEGNADVSKDDEHTTSVQLRHTADASPDAVRMLKVLFSDRVEHFTDGHHKYTLNLDSVDAEPIEVHVCSGDHGMRGTLWDQPADVVDVDVTHEPNGAVHFTMHTTLGTVPAPGLTMEQQTTDSDFEVMP